MLEFIKNNFESIISTIITTALTIGVIIKRTSKKGLRAVKIKNKLDELFLFEATEEEIKMIEKFREEKIISGNENENIKVKDIKRIAKSLTEEAIQNYKLIKSGLETLKKFKDKYEYDKHIEDVINNEN